MSGLHLHRAPALTGAILLFFAGMAQAADEPRVDLAPLHARAARADIRVDGNLVLIPVTVTDPKNHTITGLDRDAFRVFDDKSEQAVVSFSREDSPISVGIVFDLSRSMSGKLTQARRAVGEFLRSGNPEDEFLLVTFHSRAELAVPFTRSSGEIQQRLDATGAGGRTALIDAVYLALDSMKTAANSRKALLVVSDGGDNDSRFSEYELRRRLHEAGVAIYAMGIYDHGALMLPEEERGGPSLLTGLAEESGGRHFPVFRPADLPETAARIGSELRNQYVLGYSPSESQIDGRYHRLQVKLASPRNLHVTARPGYLAPER